MWVSTIHNSEHPAAKQALQAAALNQLRMDSLDAVILWLKSNVSKHCWDITSQQH